MRINHAVTFHSLQQQKVTCFSLKYHRALVKPSFAYRCRDLVFLIQYTKTQITPIETASVKFHLCDSVKTQLLFYKTSPKANQAADAFMLWRGFNFCRYIHGFFAPLCKRSVIVGVNITHPGHLIRTPHTELLLRIMDSDIVACDKMGALNSVVRRVFRPQFA